MKMIPATCQCGEEFLREPHDDYPRCSECFFEHDAPALKKLTDEVTEERPGDLRQDTNRAAATNNQEEEVAMDQYTRSNTALSDLMLELFGPGVDRIIPAHTTIRADVVRNRLAGRGDWTIWELSALADMLNVTPARLVSSVFAVAAHGKDLGDAAYELMRASQREVAA